LFAHEIDSGNQFCYRMFDLQAARFDEDIEGQELEQGGSGVALR